MAYKILVLDVDGTLVNTDKVITKAVRQGIANLLDRGIQVVIASGRATSGIMHIAKDLHMDEHDSYVVAYNGGKIVNTKTEEVIYNLTLDQEIVPEVLEFGKIHHTNFLIYKSGCIVTEDNTDPYVLVDAKGSKLPVEQVEDIRDEVTFPINKCIYTGEPSYLAELEPIAAKMFQGRLSIYRSEDFYLEALPLGVDKSYGLAKLLEKLGIDKSELVCVGDGFNDISMIQYAGLGIAMANADDQVKAAADIVAPSCDEDGVAWVIDTYFS